MSLQDLPLSDLKTRCMILKKIIKDYPDDPRINEPQRQLELIENEIKSRENPPDQVVGLNTLKLDLDIKK